MYKARNAKNKHNGKQIVKELNDSTNSIGSMKIICQVNQIQHVLKDFILSCEIPDDQLMQGKLVICCKARQTRGA